MPAMQSQHDVTLSCSAAAAAADAAAAAADADEAAADDADAYVAEATCKSPYKPLMWISS